MRVGRVFGVVGRVFEVAVGLLAQECRAFESFVLA